MYTQLFPFHQYYLHPIYIITTTLLLLLIIPVHLAQEYDKDYYFRCKNSTSLICGNTTLEMVYPFWGGDRPPYCGLEGYELKCVNDIPIISIGTGPTYRVVEIDPSTSGLILERYDDDLIYLCYTSLNRSTILNQNLFSYGMSTIDLYVYGCSTDFSTPPTFGVRNNYTCIEGPNQIIFEMEFIFQDNFETNYYCRVPVRCPVDRKVVEEFADDVKLQREELWKPSFKIHYIINKTACSESERSGGLCWRNTNSAYSRCLYEPSA